MGRLTKENIYINLQGKSKEELTELWEFLKGINEVVFRDELSWFLEYLECENDSAHLSYRVKYGDWGNLHTLNKQEVTIQQLKEILQPMGTFTPIAMKCTREQFEAIKPKLIEAGIEEVEFSDNYTYSLIRNNTFDQCTEKYAITHGFNIHEQWNEEIFLKACGIEVDTLQQQLEKAEAEVKRLKESIEEEIKPKVGDWVISELNDCVFRYQVGRSKDDLIKITDQELINKLNNLIKH